MFLAHPLKRNFSLSLRPSFPQTVKAPMEDTLRRVILPPNEGVLRRSDQMDKVIAVKPMFFHRPLSLVVLSMSLTSLSLPAAWAQSKVDYKAIPILQAMKDAAPTPELALSTPEGKKISLKEFRGKVVLLNFWASWCVPCREEMPAMEKLYQEFKDKNFVILAVAVKDSKQDTVNFVKELKLTYPIALDPDAKVGQEYGAWGLPVTYLIGPKGEGLARGWGPADWYGAAARKLIQDLLDGKR